MVVVPIYAYQCSACSHAEDVLQKMSDPILEVCPQCGKNTYVKQVTAAGFQLKGTGWYVTDFRDNGRKPSADAPSAPASGSGKDAASAAAPSSGASSTAT
jgi:putative FmdB family regulatory protein